MSYNKDTMLYEHYQYDPLRHYETRIEPVLSKWAEENQVPKNSLINNKTFLGIEVEVEGLDYSKFKGIESLTEVAHAWFIKNDGSLRNSGKEFVSLPVRGNNFVTLVHFLSKYLDKEHPNHNFSERTSVHIHVNSRKMTLEQIVSFILVYLSVEKSIFRFIKNCGWDRSNNIFCVALGESDYYIGLAGLFDYLKNNREQNLFEILQQLWKKYTAFNTLPLEKKGTIEFRHMGGTKNPQTIINWVNLIFSMKAYAEAHSIDDIVTRIQDLNVNSQYEQYLGEIFGKFTYLVSGGNLHSELEDGVCLVKDVIIWANKQKSIVSSEEEFVNSSAFKFLEKVFNLTYIKLNLDALNKELIKLKKELSNINENLKSKIEKEAYQKLSVVYYKTANRIEEIENILKKQSHLSPPKAHLNINPNLYFNNGIVDQLEIEPHPEEANEQINF